MAPLNFIHSFEFRNIIFTFKFIWSKFNEQNRIFGISSKNKWSNLQIWWAQPIICSLFKNHFFRIALLFAIERVWLNFYYFKREIDAHKDTKSMFCFCFSLHTQKYTWIQVFRWRCHLFTIFHSNPMSFSLSIMVDI